MQVQATYASATGLACFIFRFQSTEQCARVTAAVSFTTRPFQRREGLAWMKISHGVDDFHVVNRLVFSSHPDLGWQAGQ
jgi:hypothetical protein